MLYYVLSIYYFSLMHLAHWLSVSGRLIISSQLFLIYYLSKFFFFSPLPPLLSRSLWWGISILRGAMNSFDAFRCCKSFCMISSRPLGSTSPRNEHPSFAQFLRRHKNFFSQPWTPFIIASSTIRCMIVQFITPNPLAEPSQTHTTCSSFVMVFIISHHIIQKRTTTTLCPRSLPFVSSLPSQLFTCPWSTVQTR